MLVQPIQAAVPAENLFPTWRGGEPLAPHLASVSAALFESNPSLAEAAALLPFERFEAPWRSDRDVFRYNDVPAEAATLLASLSEGIQAPWLCALLLFHIDRSEQAFEASGLPAEIGLHYVDSFHRILGQIEKDPSFADLGNDSFLKDLWIARIVMIPAFAQVWWPHSGLAARDLLRGGPGAVPILLGCGGRRPFLEGHTHDPMARAYWNEAGWGEALRIAALALPALPRARGIFGTAWFYDPAIRQISPRIAFAQDLQFGRGAWRIRIGSNEAAIANATATSAERRNRYRDGTYLPTDYSLIWSRRRLLAAYGA